MSIKNLFDASVSQKSLINKSAQDVGGEVESVNYVEADISKDNRFIPPVDLSKPENFAKYGSAKEYYTRAIENVYKTYPYDGSLYERLDWENSSSYVDLHIFENEYPRTNGNITLSYDGWGTQLTMSAGYGLPESADLEYISIMGGPGVGGGPQSQGANIWSIAKNRQSNLELDLVSGSTVEFWMKKKEFIPTSTEKEVIFDLWNNELTSSNFYGRFRVELSGTTDGTTPVLLTLQSGTIGFHSQSIANSSFTTASIADNKWHHYAVTVKSASSGVLTKFYVDGNLNNETTLGTAGINKISGSMLAYIGALRTNISGNTYHGFNMTGSGKLSASLDEFRYWKAQRSSQDVGRYWFTQVGGGTNTDLANTDLGVYYKFNEGITGVAATDSVVLDYAGRVTNGSWTGYSAGARSTTSAIVESSASAKEFKDPIIYSTHPDVLAKIGELQSSGSAYDYTNNSSLFNSFPTWQQEEDSVSGDGLRNLTQIVGSYFDSLHLQIEGLGTLHDYGYVTGSDKPNVFANRLLQDRGLVTTELFFDADVLEKLADRSEDRIFAKSLTDIKNTIYKNIYNNLVNIYKTKGTYKSFRNLIRCYGIDEEILKLNMYGNNIEYELRDNRTNTDTKERLIDFVTVERQGASVYQYSSSANTSTTSYISGSYNLSGGFASTLEVDIVFPKKLSQNHPSSSTQDFPYISSSLFGIHGAIENSDQTTWMDPDAASFQVYAFRDEAHSENARFVLTSSYGSFTSVTSSLYNEVYDNSKWNLSVRTKPLRYPQVDYVLGTSASTGFDTSYVIELHGIQTEADVIINEFTISSSIAPEWDKPSGGFVTGSKRAYVGAHRQDFTGSILTRSDVKVANCRYWLNYLSDETLRYHAYDIKNYGSLSPYENSFLFQDGLSKFEVPQIDTLALNWDFNQVTSSDSSGEFVVADFSSGSTSLQNNRYGWLGPILNARHTGRGYNFPASTTAVVDVDYVISARQNHPENLYAEDMIKILSQQDDMLFTQDSRPTTFFFAFEKSMYSVISNEILNVFASIVDFNNLIGQPVNKYRDRYKQLEKLRQLFFERVENIPDLDKYIEYYKWFDSSLNGVLQQLIPASAEFSDKIRTVVESHVLERSKYQHKFPSLEMKLGDIEGTVTSPLPLSPGWIFEHHPVDDLETNNAEWWKYRAERGAVGSKLRSNDIPLDADRSSILKTIIKSRTIKRNRPWRFNTTWQGGSTTPVIHSIHGGINHFVNKKRNLTYQLTHPAGPVMPGSNIPINIMLGFEEDMLETQDIADTIKPYKKHSYNFKLDPNINRSTDVVPTADGDTLAPFALYSSSLGLTTNGYNSEVIANFSNKVELTNLHVDSYNEFGEIPMQGPFTDRFVGGRQHRHIEINRYLPSEKSGPNNLDSREDRPEGFKILLGRCGWPSGALGVVDPQYPDPGSPGVDPPYLFDRPKANLLRGATAKSPVNIANIKMTTASTKQRLAGTLHHGPIGNYQKNYQIVSSNGRTTNDLFACEQSPTIFLTSSLSITRLGSPYPAGFPTLYVGIRPPLVLRAILPGKAPFFDPGPPLPIRTGNETIIVNLFSAPGGYEVQSRGYMNPPHEEYSSYNALPYRNMKALGTAGSVETPDGGPDETIKIAPQDQLGKQRGLRPLLQLHCGRFGSDATFGSLDPDTYDIRPSYQKINRNARKRMELNGNTIVTGTVYDNWFIQHQIPRSDTQYTWITASIQSDSTLFGYLEPSGGILKSLPLVSRSVGYVYGDFIGLRSMIIDPVTSSTNTLGFPLGTNSSSYVNTALGLDFANLADWFNTLILNRGGPYGWPTWKQIRSSENPVIRNHHRHNIISIVEGPTVIEGQGPGDFRRATISYTEPPLSSEHHSMDHIIISDNKYFDRNRSTRSRLQSEIYRHEFGSKIEKFANVALNNKLGLKYETGRGDLYFNRLNSILLMAQAGSSQRTPFNSLNKVMINNGQRIFPAAYNAYLGRTRARTEFKITDVWDSSRDARSTHDPIVVDADGNTLGGLVNSQGYTRPSASVWFLDAHLNFTTKPRGDNASGSAGELQNKYCRFGRDLEKVIRPAALYAMPVPMGHAAFGGIPQHVWGGDTLWEAGAQSGKEPYQTYDEYAKYIRLIGKDYSIVPEFRISEHLSVYIEEDNGNFLVDVDSLFTLTGSAKANSSVDNFYKEYANSDFFKLFEIVDSVYENERLVNGDILSKDAVSLRCSALLKFLPYKGFYPAERTVEIAKLFSQSYGDYIDTPLKSPASYRALLEPLFAPGILHNTIKSGIAVGSFIVFNTASTPPTMLDSISRINPGAQIYNTPLVKTAATVMQGGPITGIDFGRNVSSSLQLLRNKDSNLADQHGYGFQRIPFEAIMKPAAYLSARTISGSYIYDNGLRPSASLKIDSNLASSDLSRVSWNGQGSKLYELAIDNFLCETVNFFQTGELTSLVSAREDRFKTVQSGATYAMEIKLSRPLDATGSLDRSKFEMYDRASAFGPPFAGDRVSESFYSASFDPLTPPYFEGSGSVLIVYQPTASGIPTLDDILTNSNFIYNRARFAKIPSPTSANLGEQSGYEWAMQLSESIKLTETLPEIIPRTTTPKNKWLIQSKFETPVLNFAGVSATLPATGSVSAIISKGMWHQYGSLPTGRNDTIKISIETPSIVQSRFNVNEVNSLAEIVGFAEGSSKNIGVLRDAGRLEEAVVAIPFMPGCDNRRKFFRVNKNQVKVALGGNGRTVPTETVKDLVAAMQKYIFPPKFDFITNPSVDPIAMYVFEFGMDLDQKAYADMWQNLPPENQDNFTTATSTVTHKMLAQEFFNNSTKKMSSKLRWLIFKVKKRAEKDYNRFVKKNLMEDLDSVVPNIVSPYSYNWPYDYFSLVELIKLDTTVQYASSKEEDSEVQSINIENEVLRVELVTPDEEGN